MAHILSDKEYRELCAYRETGFSPEGITKLAGDLLDPSPLPIDLTQAAAEYDTIMDAINRGLAEEAWKK